MVFLDECRRMKSQTAVIPSPTATHGMIHTIEFNPSFGGSARACSPCWSMKLFTIASSDLPWPSCVAIFCRAGLEYSHCSMGQSATVFLHAVHRHASLT